MSSICLLGSVAALHTSKRVRNVIPYQMDGQLCSTNDILVDDMSFKFVGDLMFTIFTDVSM